MSFNVLVRKLIQQTAEISPRDTDSQSVYDANGGWSSKLARSSLSDLPISLHIYSLTMYLQGCKSQDEGFFGIGRVFV